MALSNSPRSNMSSSSMPVSFTARCLYRTASASVDVRKDVEKLEGATTTVYVTYYVKHIDGCTNGPSCSSSRVPCSVRKRSIASCFSPLV